MITRRQWGADESMRTRTPVYNNSLGGVTIHHTAGNNNYTEAEARQIVRGIYPYHATTLGWGDVGYHALVDKFGNIYEGRYGGMDKPVQGAHAGGFNQNTAGFSMIGSYVTVAPTSAQIEAMSDLVGWRLAVANRANPSGTQPVLTATGKTVMYSEGTTFTWVPRGQAITLPIVFAHRDVNNTQCPGDRGYQYMNQIRNAAAAYMGGAGSGPVSPIEPSTGGPSGGNRIPTDFGSLGSYTRHFCSCKTGGDIH